MYIALFNRPMNPQSQGTSGFRNYRWVICALLFFATTINYTDRQILGLCKGMIGNEMHWSDTAYGLVNSAFQFAYGFGMLAFGWFVDRFGVKIGFSVSIVAWSIAAGAYWFVSNITGFFALRAWVGLGESGNFPASIKATAQWFPKRERALATSIFNSGCNVAGIIGPAVVPFIALTLNFGWRGVYVASAASGFIWLVFWLIFYQVPEKMPRLNAAEREHILSDRDEAQQLTQQKMPWASLLGYRQTWSFIIAKFMTDPIWWFFLIWLPDYFNKIRGLDIKHSWPQLVTIYTIITVLSIFGGWITGHLASSGWTITRARKTGMFVFALCLLPMLIVTHVGNWTAVLLFGLAGSAHQAWSANLFTTVSDMFPKKAVASIIGIGGLAGAMGGVLFPIICGKVLDHFTVLGNETAGYTLLLSICAFAYLIAFALNHLCAPKFEQVQIKPA
jgi:ACS family hexuronate transporter-like MFS transporter